MQLALLESSISVGLTPAAPGQWKLKELRQREGIEIVPAEPGFCSAKCFHVLLNGKVNGAAVILEVPDYPESKLEIIAADKIMDVLTLSIGDEVIAEIK